MSDTMERFENGVDEFIKYNLEQELGCCYDFLNAGFHDNTESIDDWLYEWSMGIFAKNMVLNGVETQFIDHDLFDSEEVLEYMKNYIQVQDDIKVPADYKLDTFDSVLDMYLLCYVNDECYRGHLGDKVMTILKRDMAEKYIEIGEAERMEMFEEEVRGVIEIFKDTQYPCRFDGTPLLCNGNIVTHKPKVDLTVGDDVYVISQDYNSSWDITTEPSDEFIQDMMKTQELEYQRFCKLWEEEEEFCGFQGWITGSRMIYRYYDMTVNGGYILK